MSGKDAVSVRLANIIIIDLLFILQSIVYTYLLPYISNSDDYTLLYFELCFTIM